MQSFDIKFSNDGKALIGNIQGVTPGTSECVALTAPYENSLGVAERLEVLDGCAVETVATRQKETA